MNSPMQAAKGCSLVDWRLWLHIRRGAADRRCAGRSVGLEAGEWAGEGAWVLAHVG